MWCVLLLYNWGHYHGPFAFAYSLPLIFNDLMPYLFNKQIWTSSILYRRTLDYVHSSNFFIIKLMQQIERTSAYFTASVDQRILLCL